MTAEPGTKFRTNIIKVPDATPGLLFIDGEQKQFVLEGIWHSPLAPAPNLAVDVELDSTGAVVSITVANLHPSADKLIAQPSSSANEEIQHIAELAKKGVLTLSEKMGIPALSAAIVLWIACFFMPSISIGPPGASLTFSFWSLLGYDIGHPETMAAAGSYGLWAIVGLIALVAPFIAPFLKFSWARYLYAAPAGYLLLACIVFWWDLNQAMSAARNSFGSLGGDAAATMMKSMSDLYSISWGAYLLGIAAAALLVNALITKPDATVGHS